MQNNNQGSQKHEILAVQCSDRWQIYHRLQALDISCQCESHKPLAVKVDNIRTAIQLWSVAKQCTASREELVHWLNNCWRLKS